MTDKQLCEMFGITLEEVAKEVNKIDRDDYSSWDFSRTIKGSPMDHERMTMVSAPIAQSRIDAMQRIANEQGISRAEFIRRAIDHELLALA
jgi:hypothetical protein